MAKEKSVGGMWKAWRDSLNMLCEKCVTVWRIDRRGAIANWQMWK